MMNIAQAIAAAVIFGFAIVGALAIDGVVGCPDRTGYIEAGERP